MKLKELKQKMFNENNFAMLLVLNSKGYPDNADVTGKMISDFNLTAENVYQAIDEWRINNEEQYQEDSDDFDNWNGDVLEVGESFESSYFTDDEIKEVTQ